MRGFNATTTDSPTKHATVTWRLPLG